MSSVGRGTHGSCCSRSQSASSSESSSSLTNLKPTYLFSGRTARRWGCDCGLLCRLRGCPAPVPAAALPTRFWPESACLTGVLPGPGEARRLRCSCGELLEPPGFGEREGEAEVPALRPAVPVLPLTLRLGPTWAELLACPSSRPDLTRDRDLPTALNLPVVLEEGEPLREPLVRLSTPLVSLLSVPLSWALNVPLSEPELPRPLRRTIMPTAWNLVRFFFVLRPGLLAFGERPSDGETGVLSCRRSFPFLLAGEVTVMCESPSKGPISESAVDTRLFGSRFFNQAFTSGSFQGAPRGLSSSFSNRTLSPFVMHGPIISSIASCKISDAMPPRPGSGIPSVTGLPLYRSRRSDSVSTWCWRLSKMVKISCTS
mmetsp:Transcript_137152/g.382562  ORF Transcript_137152/g.382562 Transcript_137152/m.382562 type:complete len:372 (+) Transcript_137152:593-1708(+)